MADDATRDERVGLIVVDVVDRELRTRRDAPAARTTSTSSWQYGDILLTTLVFLCAAYDLTNGLMNLAATTWTLEVLQNFKTSDLDDQITVLTRVRGVSGIEAGLASLLIGIYRMARWGRRKKFNGINFQLIFFLQTVGRSPRLYLQIEGWTTPMPPAFYMSLSRLITSFLAFLLSLYVYRESWHWLWD